MGKNKYYHYFVEGEDEEKMLKVLNGFDFQKFWTMSDEAYLQAGIKNEADRIRL